MGPLPPPADRDDGPAAWNILGQRFARFRQHGTKRLLGDAASFYLPYLDEAIAAETLASRLTVGHGAPFAGLRHEEHVIDGEPLALRIERAG